MRLNQRTLIVLGVGLLVIVALLLLPNIVTGPAANPTPTPGGVIPGAPLFAQVVPDTVVTLEARNNTENTFITYTRSAAQVWSVTQGTMMQPGVEVDQSRLTQWVQGLALGSSTRILPPENNSLVTFGLGAPTYTLTMITNTNTTHRLQVGLEGPTGYYAIVDDNQTQIHIVPKTLITPLIESITNPPYAGGTPTPVVTPTAPSELVIFPNLIADDISAVTVINNQTNEFVSVSRNTLDVWNIDSATNSQQRPTDQFQSQLIAAQIPTFRAEQRFNLADVGTTLATYGLDNPSYSAQIITRTGRLYTVLIGGRAPSGGYYVTYTVSDAPQATPEATAQMGPVLPPAPETTAVVEMTPEATAALEATVEATAAPKVLPQESTPEATPEATVAPAEVTPAPVVEATAEMTAEATAENTAQPQVLPTAPIVYVVPADTVEVLINLIAQPPYLAAPEITPEATAEATGDAAAEATVGAEMTVDVTLEPTAEVTTVP